MTEILTIECGQKDDLLRRANVKKNKKTKNFLNLPDYYFWYNVNTIKWFSHPTTGSSFH